MDNFRSGGFSQPRFGEQQKFPAVCSDCGQSCTVPFPPKEGRPVYCKDCFRKRKSTQ